MKLSNSDLFLPNNPYLRLEYLQTIALHALCKPKILWVHQFRWFKNLMAKLINS